MMRPLNYLLAALLFFLSTPFCMAQSEDAENAAAFYKTVAGAPGSWSDVNYLVMPAVVMFGDDTTDKVTLIAANKTMYHRLYKEMAVDAYSKMMYEKLAGKETLVISRTQYQDLLSTGSVYAIKQKECTEYVETKFRQMLKKYFYGAYPSYARPEFSLKNEECRCLVNNMYNRHIYMAEHVPIGNFIYSEKYAVKGD